MPIMSYGIQEKITPGPGRVRKNSTWASSFRELSKKVSLIHFEIQKDDAFYLIKRNLFIVTDSFLSVASSEKTRFFFFITKISLKILKLIFI